MVKTYNIQYCNMGVAVAVKEGLLVPVVKEAEKKMSLR